MRIEIVRRWFTSESTLGDLIADGVHVCFSLEDVDRGLHQSMDVDSLMRLKVPRATAIPLGVYELVIDYSPRFKRDMPRLINVPGFVGIRIHPGNDANATEGCILVGMERDMDRIMRSLAAFEEVYRLVVAARDRGEEITVEVSRDESADI